MTESEDRQGEPKAACGAKRRQGGGVPCKQRAGHGTSHVGYGRCKYHGGASPSGAKAAAKQRAKEWSELKGIAKSPEETMVHVLSLANGEIAYFQAQLEGHEPNSQEWYEMLRLRDQAAEEAFTYAADTLSAGLDLRRTELAEQLGALWGSAMQGLLSDLALSGEQRAMVPSLLDSHLGKMGARVLELECGGNGDASS